MIQWNERLEYEAALLADEFTGIVSRETVLLFMKEAGR
jgi:hypothetical protein